MNLQITNCTNTQESLKNMTLATKEGLAHDKQVEIETHHLRERPQSRNNHL